MRFKGKKLLVLGATSNEIPLVERAQAMGIYVIVSDYNHDHRISPAKDVADEYWDVSWSDIDALENLCREKCIDGITAGYSEFRVDCLVQLTSRLGLPCYTTDQQLAVTRNKELFKSKCREYGVPVVKEYCSIEDVDSFPVIVKPVDRAGSIGVGIAYNQQELKVAYEEAMEKSVEKRVIIEEYITNSVEMDAHYAVCNGKPVFLCTDEIIQAANNVSEGKVCQSAWLFPSKYEQDYLEKVDTAMQSMIKGMGIQAGTIFFSGFADEQGEFAFFECGYRLWGEQEFEYDYRKGLMNYLDIYIIHALTGDTSNVPYNDLGNPNLRCVEVNCYVRGGTIAEISGLEEIAKMKNCSLAIKTAYEGKECDGSKAILTKSAVFGFTGESIEELETDVSRAYAIYQVLDTEGKDMMYDKVPFGLITKRWD